MAGKPVTLAVGGLGVKGVATIGVLQSLHEHNINIKRIIAAGASALVAGQYAMGRDLERLTGTFLQFFEEHHKFLWGLEQVSGVFKKRRRAIRSFSYFLQERLYCRANIDRISILTWDTVEPLLKDFFGKTTFNDLKIPVTVSTVDLKANQLFFIESGGLVEAMKAGIAFPGLFPPVPFGERILVSSTLCCEVPVEAITREDSPVLAIDFPSISHQDPPRSLLETIALTAEARSTFIKNMLLGKVNYVFRLEGMERYQWGNYRQIPAMVAHARKETDRQLARVDEFRRRNIARVARKE